MLSLTWWGWCSTPDMHLLIQHRQYDYWYCNSPGSGYCNYTLSNDAAIEVIRFLFMVNRLG
jgi:hypothetical protein